MLFRRGSAWTTLTRALNTRISAPCGDKVVRLSRRRRRKCAAPASLRPSLATADVKMGLGILNGAARYPHDALDDETDPRLRLQTSISRCASSASYFCELR